MVAGGVAITSLIHFFDGQQNDTPPAYEKQAAFGRHDEVAQRPCDRHTSGPVTTKTKEDVTLSLTGLASCALNAFFDHGPRFGSSPGRTPATVPSCLFCMSNHMVAVQHRPADEYFDQTGMTLV